MKPEDNPELARHREAVSRARTLRGEGAGARLALARELLDLAEFCDDAGRRNEGLRAANEARGYLEQLDADSPGARRLDLARVHGTLGNLLERSGHGPEALAAAKQAIALRLPLDRKDIEQAAGLGLAYRTLSQRLFLDGQLEDSRGTLEQAVDLYRQLAARRPERFCPDLGATLAQLGDSFEALGQLPDAFEVYHEAIVVLKEPFVARPQDHTAMVEGLVLHYRSLAESLGRSFDRDLVDQMVELVAAVRAIRRPDSSGSPFRSSSRGWLT